VKEKGCRSRSGTRLSGQRHAERVMCSQKLRSCPQLVEMLSTTFSMTRDQSAHSGTHPCPVCPAVDHSRILSWWASYREVRHTATEAHCHGAARPVDGLCCGERGAAGRGRLGGIAVAAADKSSTIAPLTVSLLVVMLQTPPGSLPWTWSKDQ
jgi:hypothetical protein